MSSDDPRSVAANPDVEANAQSKTDSRPIQGRMPQRASDRRNDRPLPASVLTPPPAPPPPHLDDYIAIVGQSQVDTLRSLAKEVKGKTIKMVNSTAVGGGVAEMLNRFVPLLSELDVPTHWDVITGGHDFF